MRSQHNKEDVLVMKDVKEFTMLTCRGKLNL